MRLALPPPHRAPTTTLTIRFSVRHAIERFHYQRDQLKREPSRGSPKHWKTLNSWTLVGVSDMGRIIVEELATLASLALFLSMVAIWAQVIGAL
jgi:hypothetical protein